MIDLLFAPGPGSASPLDPARVGRRLFDVGQRDLNVTCLVGNYDECRRAPERPRSACSAPAGVHPSHFRLHAGQQSTIRTVARLIATRQAVFTVMTSPVTSWFRPRSLRIVGSPARRQTATSRSIDSVTTAGSLRSRIPLRSPGCVRVDERTSEALRSCHEGVREELGCSAVVTTRPPAYVISRPDRTPRQRFCTVLGGRPSLASRRVRQHFARRDEPRHGCVRRRRQPVPLGQPRHRPI